MCCGWWGERRGKDTPGSKGSVEQGGGAPSAPPAVRLPSCDLERYKVEEPLQRCLLSAFPPATSSATLPWAVNHAEPRRRQVVWPTSWKAGSWLVTDPRIDWVADVLHARSLQSTQWKATGCEVPTRSRSRRNKDKCRSDEGPFDVRTSAENTGGKELWA